MNPILIVVGAGFLLVIVALIAMVNHHMKAEDQANELLDQANVKIRDLRRELSLSNQLASKQADRAERLLAQVYELRREMGLSPRAHTECFDRWVDGGQACPDCQLLLGVRGG